MRAVEASCTEGKGIWRRGSWPSEQHAFWHTFDLANERIEKEEQEL